MSTERPGHIYARTLQGRNVQIIDGFLPVNEVIARSTKPEKTLLRESARIISEMLIAGGGVTSRGVVIATRQSALPLPPSSLDTLSERRMIRIPAGAARDMLSFSPQPEIGTNQVLFLLARDFAADVVVKRFRRNSVAPRLALQLAIGSKIVDLRALERAFAASIEHQYKEHKVAHPTFPYRTLSHQMIVETIDRYHSAANLSDDMV